MHGKRSVGAALCTSHMLKMRALLFMSSRFESSCVYGLSTLNILLFTSNQVHIWKTHVLFLLVVTVMLLSIVLASRVVYLALRVVGLVGVFDGFEGNVSR